MKMAKRREVTAKGNDGRATFLASERIRIIERRRREIEKMGALTSRLYLVQCEQNGTRHYKDNKGNRLILYPDNSFGIEGGDWDARR